MISQEELQLLSDEFLDVFRHGKLRRRSSLAIQNTTISDAYCLQDRVIASRINDGERVAGYKVGCTSEAIRQQFGLTEPIYGRLMYPYVYFGDTELNWLDYVNCAIEPEFVLSIGKEINGERLDANFLHAAIDAISVGIEVHNYRFWSGHPTSQELIASNGIHACLVVGAEKYPVKHVDLRREQVQVFVNGQLKASGLGSEIMDGGPLASLRWLARRLRRRGESLKPGQLIIPGSPVKLVEVPPNAFVRASITSFGSVDARFISKSVCEKSLECLCRLG